MATAELTVPVVEDFGASVFGVSPLITGVAMSGVITDGKKELEMENFVTSFDGSGKGRGEAMIMGDQRWFGWGFLFFFVMVVRVDFLVLGIGRGGFFMHACRTEIVAAAAAVISCRSEEKKVNQSHGLLVQSVRKSHQPTATPTPTPRFGCRPIPFGRFS
ncbi:hypothetical protein BDD12DRAFT_801962 [Trichophaea hybrida]|nr:hypothetical protein BDD12DRAFT_801962 [Trichophaea hybrida]